MKCYLCGQEIAGSQWTQEHHPEREEKPNWTETVHSACHASYHTANGDFKRWGALSSGAGRKGYTAAIEKEPQFHRLGGLTRTLTADRDKRGRFIKGNSS